MKMSKTTDQLEDAVAVVIANRAEEGAKQTARQRVETDKAFARILSLIAPRIRHFIRQYGLAAHWDDAEQVCAIAVHRAIEMYEPEKARFTTFVNWQIRGELQGLRFRLMADQRPSAKKVSATTVSLQALEHRGEGEDSPVEFSIEDEGALTMTEAAAADHLAARTASGLLDAYVAHLREVGVAQLRRARTRATTGRSRNPAIDPVELEKLEQRIMRDRDIVAQHLFGTEDHSDTLTADLTRERLRQITRRAARIIGELAVRRDQRPTSVATARGLLPSLAERHNQMVRVKASVATSQRPVEHRMPDVGSRVVSPIVKLH